MRTLNATIIVMCVIALVGATGSATASGKRDLGRETLAPNDGWAAEGPGTTGGSLAMFDHVYTVHNRQELVAALNDGVYPPPSTTPSSAPKIIYVDGTIDANVDDNNVPLTCQDYYRNGYTLEAFLAAYDPAVWGRVPVSGTLETARIASREAQKARVQIAVGSNTTIVGLGKHARIRGAQLDLRGSSSNQRSNVIIRNITFQDTFDCFPAWSPTDGALGSWNAEYDAIALRQIHHVWIDHNVFEDKDTIDSTEPTYFGVHYERHDGLTDITNASNYVTVSWNQYRNHDKVMLIGSSDSGSTAAGDRGKLKVTIHHNLFLNLGQRTPRVRFGQVHVYNNYYQIIKNPGYVYSWGVGIESATYAENNFFVIDKSVTPDRFIAVYKGTAIHVSGTLVNGFSNRHRVDVLAAYNAVNDPDLSGDVGWTPTLFTHILPTQYVPVVVLVMAGPFGW
jgi:pectate lyase